MAALARISEATTAPCPPRPWNRISNILLTSLASFNDYGNGDFKVAEQLFRWDTLPQDGNE
jgi:hypothetical protein